MTNDVSLQNQYNTPVRLIRECAKLQCLSETHVKEKLSSHFEESELSFVV